MIRKRSSIFSFVKLETNSIYLSGLLWALEARLGKLSSAQALWCRQWTLIALMIMVVGTNLTVNKFRAESWVLKCTQIPFRQRNSKLLAAHSALSVSNTPMP